jgi:hypothetical protein
MLKKLVFLALLLSAANVFAAGVSFQVTSLKSRYVDGFGRLELIPLADGAINVVIDRNVCAADGPCTQMAVVPERVEPQVVHDDRSADGELVLRLTPELTLTVTSGFTGDRMVETYVTYTSPLGKQVRVPLSTNLSVQAGR